MLIKYIIRLAIAAILLTSCRDDIDGANILITVKHGIHTIGQATVYVKFDALSNPGIPLSEYEWKQRADGTGQAYFPNIKPGNYYIYTLGNDTQSNTNVGVDGGMAVTINASDSGIVKFTIPVN